MKLMFPYSVSAAEKILSRSHAFKALPSRREDEITVSAVQYRLQPKANLEEYIADVEMRYRLAAEQGARLLAFPELFGLTPLCCAPLWKRLFSGSAKGAESFKADTSPANLSALRIYPVEKGLLPGLIKLLCPTIEAACEISAHILSSLSRKYSVLTADGSSLRFIDGRLYNVQTLYGSDGRIIGQQKKINPMESELRLGIGYADEINVFDTEIGRVAIPICMDASYFENFRLFHEKGVRLVALGTCNMEPYDPYLALRGIRLRCSEYPMYAVKAAMTGCAAHMPITGRAEIVAPYWLAPEGLLRQSDSSDGDGLISAAIKPAPAFPADARHDEADTRALSALLKNLY